MFSQFLWMLAAKQQHDLQKEQGLPGLMGILFVLLVTWKWNDWFYPLFKGLGMVDVFVNAGVVQEGNGILNVINVMAILFLLLIFFLIGIPIAYIALFIVGALVYLPYSWVNDKMAALAAKEIISRLDKRS